MKKSLEINFDDLVELYGWESYVLAESFKSMRGVVNDRNQLLIKGINIKPNGELVIKTANELEAFLLKHFPKRIYYQYSDIKRNALNFTLIKSKEAISHYKVPLALKHPDRRIVIVSKGTDNKITLTGTDHDINNFSVEEDFDQLSWTTNFLIDTNKLAE